MSLFLSLTCGFAHAQVVLDGTTGGVAGQTLGAGTLPNGETLSDGSTMTDHLIPHDVGTLIDHNLFHSFQDFSIAKEKSATFTGPNTINNVLSRVTGGNASDIQGKIASTIENANLFLFNPNGVIFGSNATLDLRGSFHVSTADSIGFQKNGAVLNFYADVSLDGTAGSVLHVPSLETFGFLGDPNTFAFTQQVPAPIIIDKSLTINPSPLAIREKKTLSFIGGDLNVMASISTSLLKIATLQAPSGRINLVSVASPGEVGLDPSAQEVGVKLEGFTRLGRINLNKGAWIETTTLKDPVTKEPASNNGAGTVVIRGGHLTLANRSFVFSDTSGTLDGAPVGIDIDVTHDLVVSGGGRITSEAGSDNKGGSPGDVRIKAGSIEVTGFGPAVANNDITTSQIASRLFPDSTGNGGNIFIETGTLQVTNKGEISTSTVGSGKPGELQVTADTIHLASGGQMVSTTEGPGSGGNVQVTGIDSIQIDGAGSGIFSGTIKFDPNVENSSSGGTITVQTSALRLSNGAIISTATASKGQAGSMSINVETLLTQDAQITSSSTSPITDAGPAGSIDIHTRESIHMSRTTISTTVQGGSQPGGAITLNGGKLVLLQDGTTVSATNRGTGVAGDVLIGGVDSSSAVKRENGQTIPLVNTIRIENSTVSTNSNSASGGNISLNADFLIDLINGRIESEIGEGTKGGNIDLDPQFIVLQGDTLISTRSRGAGGGGIVTLGRPGDTILTDSGRNAAEFVDVSSVGGQAGEIIIRGATQNLSQETTPLTLSFPNVANLFASRCAAQQEGQFSSIVERPPDGLPPVPGDFSPSPLTLDGPGGFLAQNVGGDAPPRLEAPLLKFSEKSWPQNFSQMGHYFFPVTCSPAHDNTLGYAVQHQ